MENITIINVGYYSTNYWVASAGTSRLLVDLGWPGTMGRMQANLRRMDVPLEEIRFGLATHYHIDHAGLAQELKDAGVPLLVLDLQVKAIPMMNRWTKQWTKSRHRFVDVTLHDNVVISPAESRSMLRKIGIDGEILYTPGHSDDSVSLLLDDGSAFTGDLPIPETSEPKNLTVVSESWRQLFRRGATVIYPGHGAVRALDGDFTT